MTGLQEMTGPATPSEIMPRTTAAVGHEWSLLLSACSAISPQEKLVQLRGLTQHPVRWRPVFELAERHGTQPLLYQALSGLEPAVPPEEMFVLQQAYRTNLHKALLLSRELIRIVEALTALGIEVMPYKGPALAEVLY